MNCFYKMWILCKKKNLWFKIN